jgi:protein SCO1/2
MQRLMNRSHLFAAAWLTAGWLVLATASCSPRSEPPPASTGGTTTNQRTFIVRGVLKETRPNGTTAVIQHEEIPNYMPAMTMPLSVKDPKELAGLKPNDEIQFRMVVTENDGWIEQVTRTGAFANTNAAGLPRNFRLVRDVDPLNVGDAMKNYAFTNELGRAVQLTDFKGRAYAFTFIFTRCPFPVFCPRMADNFGAAARLLKQGEGAPTNWHLLSITFDVEYDTPAVLKQYATGRDYDPERWSFLTGALIDIDAITEQFGLTFSRSAGGIGFDHNLRTVVVDTRGVIRKILIGNEWKAEELADALAQAAGP